MIAVDTNVLVRVLVADDAKQAEAARRWMSAHEVDGIFVDHIVLVELVWVLRSRYAQSRSSILRALDLLLATGGVVVPAEHTVRLALEAFRAGQGDFADHLIRERALAHSAAPVATFDAQLHHVRGFSRVR